jgi:hypothetical protein
VVVLGSAASDGVYAQHDDAKAVFVAPRLLAQQARGWLLNRAAMVIDPSSVERIRLELGERRLEVIAEGGRFTVEGDPQSQLGEQIRRALEQLMAERVIHLGPKTAADALDPPRARLSIDLTTTNKPVVLLVGQRQVVDGAPVHVLRREGIDASFAVAEGRVTPLLEAP